MKPSIGTGSSVRRAARNSTILHLALSVDLRARSRGKRSNPCWGPVLRSSYPSSSRPPLFSGPLSSSQSHNRSLPTMSMSTYALATNLPRSLSRNLDGAVVYSYKRQETGRDEVEKVCVKCCLEGRLLACQRFKERVSPMLTEKMNLQNPRSPGRSLKP